MNMIDPDCPGIKNQSQQGGKSNRVSCRQTTICCGPSGEHEQPSTKTFGGRKGQVLRFICVSSGRNECNVHLNGVCAFH